MGVLERIGATWSDAVVKLILMFLMCWTVKALDWDCARYAMPNMLFSNKADNYSGASLKKK